MRVYPDASFLVSWLYSADVNNGRARTWFSAHQTDDWIVSEWSWFESVNALRSLCLASGGPRRELVEGLRRYFKRLLRVGPFDFERVDWDDVLKDANQISTGYAARQRARAADTLHVAILEQVQPDLFVTGDRDQTLLARARGFNAVQF